MTTNEREDPNSCSVFLHMDMQAALAEIDDLRKTVGEYECRVAEFTGFTNEGDNQSFDLMLLVANELKKADDECIQQQAATIAGLWKHAAQSTDIAALNKLLNRIDEQAKEIERLKDELRREKEADAQTLARLRVYQRLDSAGGVSRD